MLMELILASLVCSVVFVTSFRLPAMDSSIPDAVPGWIVCNKIVPSHPDACVQVNSAKTSVRLTKTHYVVAAVAETDGFLARRLVVRCGLTADEIQALRNLRDVRVEVQFRHGGGVDGLVGIEAAGITGLRIDYVSRTVIVLSAPIEDTGVRFSYWGTSFVNEELGNAEAVSPNMPGVQE